MDGIQFESEYGKGSTFSFAIENKECALSDLDSSIQPRGNILNEKLISFGLKSETAISKAYDEKDFQDMDRLLHPKFMTKLTSNINSFLYNLFS